MNKRIRSLNTNKINEGECVVYVMSRDQRVADNHALIAAQKTAIAQDVPVIVYFILYPESSVRLKNQYLWMLEGLKETEETLREKNIAFNLEVGTAYKSYKKILKKHNPLAFFFDFSPLRSPKKVKKQFADEVSIPCYVVDTHNVVPVWEASEKEEYAARTIRKKITSKLDRYLIEADEIKKQESCFGKSEINWKEVEDSIKAPYLEDYVPVVKSGERHGIEAVKNFIETKLEDYDELRNDPANNHLSDLSAYFHFGQVSTLQVALALKKAHPRAFKLPGSSTAGKLESSIESFLEESIIRKELSDNFCYYNENYDNLAGAKQWARQTLEEHKNDPREFLYSYKELENAKTHDEAWNAAQIQMRKTGKMHGYMRMYWAKKILEWTPNPETALEFAIKLNDTYELDGYDPNGYVGCMWSIAGVHDRGWTEREIFGKIRYMNFNGLKRKFDIESYIKLWIQVE